MNDKQSIISKAKELFNNKEYKQSLFVLTDLTKTLSEEDGNDVYKDCYMLISCCFSELISLEDDQFDFIIGSAEIAARYAANNNEIDEISKNICEHINSRFISLADTHIKEIENFEKHKSVYIGFFIRTFNKIHDGLFDSLVPLLKKEDKKVAGKGFMYGRTETSSLFEDKLFEQAVSLNHKAINLTNEFPYYTQFDYEKAFLYWDVARSMLLAIIPDKEDEDKIHSQKLILWIKGQINIVCNELNAVIVVNKNMVSLISTIDSRKELISEISQLSARIKKYEPAYEHPQVFENPTSIKASGGCYVATAVYGSYDCPEVWTLRRYRDCKLAVTWYGRAFIRTYYTISPMLVKWFGHTEWFKKIWREKLDKIVSNLQAKGVESTPYTDQEW